MTRASTEQWKKSKSGILSVRVKLGEGELELITDNPIHRFRAFLVAKKWWSEPEETVLLAKHRESVLTAFRRAEKLPRPKLGEMFNDVWAVKKGEEAPRVIVSGQTVLRLADSCQMEQKAELGRLLKKYGDAWEPWRRDRKKYVEEGEDVMDSDGRV